MQSVSSKIWTRVAVSISYNDDHYTTSTSTESILIAAQNNAIRTKYINAKIDKTQQNSKRR